MKEIKLIRINAYGIINSFRIPLHMTIHDTLDLPVKTHIIGMIAAAMGYLRDDKEKIESLYKNTSIGIYGTSYSKFYDLIRIYKYKGKEVEVSLVNRQINYKNNYTIYIENNNLEEIYNFLKNPVFALSLGKAHDLINIKDISIINATIVEDDYIDLSNTVLPFNLYDFEIIDLKDNTNITPFQTYKLPLSFNIEKNYREATHLSDTTIIGDIKLKIKRNKEYKTIHDNEGGINVIIY
ncbi:type I-E CRISPR-associated protein Cas5/CasD [Ferroplasma acidarmanus]|uniref:CRISPR-associated protein Cas5 n=1 Tax=Ferroplasma acidarmanus Fer1 TaxID=333146 RepID=S0ALV2_FERAC|nr:type I-E CRISPR-associated protein Cas5/CasD [Ferroplasma acidarmanus]AGO59986.1 hypothetical protein FACI_IFERC00001G0006 [Ferroplasma acidarmanus Fer1]